MSEPLRILMVEDKEADAILAQRELRRQGLTVTVRRVDHDHTLQRALHEFAPDLVLSDLSLPGFSGLEALAIVRKERPGTPLIFVSGTINEDQAVELLKLGATDYVLKDRLARLPSSVRRALREVQLEAEHVRAAEQHRIILEKMETQVSSAQRQAAGESGDHLPVSVAHDLNNILAPISMAVAMLRTGMPAAERDRMYAIIEQSARRATEITREALAGHRRGENEWRPLGLERIIKGVFQKLQQTWPENLRVKFVAEDDLWAVSGNAAQLGRAVLDLCVRAGSAMPGGGTLRLHLGNRPVTSDNQSDATFVALEVSDTGRGATLRVDGGPEPGLEAAWGIVQRHGGSIRVASIPGDGTTFTVLLPAVRGTVVPERRASVGGECILLVDDEETIRFAAKTVLSRQGYRVLTATDGVEALRVFAAHGDEIALVLTDVMMPLMNGVALAKELKELRPGVPIIASSGQNEEARQAELLAAGVEAVLAKPYAADALLRTVDEALARRAG